MANRSDRWYFSKEKLRNTPSTRDGIEIDRERGYRQQCANLVQDIGQRLQVNQLVINTAIVYMHRFYMFHSFNSYHRNIMAACFIFLSAKVEEQPRKLEHILKASHKCLHKDDPQIDPKSDDYLQLSQELVNNESILLQTLGFEVSVDHPNTYVVKCAQLVKASKELAQTAYFLATNSLHLTTFCIQYRPTVVACVCIYVSCLWANYLIPETDGKNWYEYIDNTTTKKQLEDLSSRFIKILDFCPTRLKKRLTLGAVVYKEGKVVAKKEVETSKDGSTPSNKHDSSGAKNVTTTKAETLSKTLPAKTQLTGLLKPQPHEATPPPSRSVSSSNHKKTVHHNNDHQRNHQRNDLHKHRSSSSIITNHEHPSLLTDDKRSIHPKSSKDINKSHHHKTPEQLRMETKKKTMTSEQWEEYKKRKEKERLYYQKKKLAEKERVNITAMKTSSNTLKTERVDGHLPRVRKTSHSESPVKKQKLEHDHNKKGYSSGHENNSNNTSINEENRNTLINSHQKSKSHRSLPDTHRSMLSSSGSDSDNSVRLKIHHNSQLHNRLNITKHEKKVNGSKPLPPPPPPPMLNPNSKPVSPISTLNPDNSSSKLNTPHYGIFSTDDKTSKLSPPPPPPPPPIKFV